MKLENLIGIAAIAALAVSINWSSLVAAQNNDTIKTSDIPSIAETIQAAKDALESGNASQGLIILNLTDALLTDNESDIENYMRTNVRCSSADPCTPHPDKP